MIHVAAQYLYYERKSQKGKDEPAGRTHAEREHFGIQERISMKILKSKNWSHRPHSEYADEGTLKIPSLTLNRIKRRNPTNRTAGHAQVDALSSRTVIHTHTTESQPPVWYSTSA
jgi:hypothetical protein